MATFYGRYSSEHSPEVLWRVINKPLSTDLADLVHEGVEVRYDSLGEDGQIELGSSITYVPTDTFRERVPLQYRRFVPEDVAFFVHGMTDQGFGKRRDTLMSGKATGGITRSVEANGGNASFLVVEASLSIAGLGGMLDRPIQDALRATVGNSSEATLALIPEILES